MPTGGCLTIRTANVEIPAAGGGVHEDVPPGRYALLAISDTGTGMSEETRGHLFEPFFTTKGVGEGTGLGLSSVYGIVQQSGGHIRVDTGPGRGTAFRIYLPATEAGGGSADPSPDGQEASAPRGAETILLLEDERAICDLLAAELQDLGYRVLPCQTVGQAIGATEEHEKPIDLLLTDVVLPGMSGPTLARTLRERGKVRQVMFMSGHTEKHIVQHGVLKDGVAFIGKPFTTEALARKIRELLDGKTARQRPPGTGDRAGR
jgi:CheY-like chemotaxis protein